MDREFIDFEQALALKELGFDEPCIKYYWTDGMLVAGYENPFNYNKRDNVISAPLYQQSFRWFREKYNLLGEVYSNASGWLWEICDNIGGTHRYGSDWSGDCEESGMFTSFEKAELACLIKLIEISKNK